MNFPKPLIIFLLVIFALYSCKDIIEPNISNRPMISEAPGDQYQTNNYQINFWWDEVEDALAYHLQVVTPSFDKVGGLVLDTIIKTNRFTINLSPGIYQWRVQAQNGSYKTQFSTPKSFVISQSSITGQMVQLSSPANNLITNQGTTVFQWGNIFGANKYRIEIDTNSFTDETKVLYNQAIASQQLNFTFPKDQIYQWRVRAENDTAQSKWSAVFTITYDHTPPPVVNLISPNNNQQASLPVSLQWSSVNSAAKYKLYVFKADSVTTYNSTFPLSVNTPGYNFNTGAIGDRVYWKVTAVDAAGNEGKATPLRSFVLQ
jgi:hypothetical protein